MKTKQMESHTCEKRIFSTYTRSSCKCGKNAKVERNGKWYCGIHDPIKIKERDDNKMVEYKERVQIRKNERRRQTAEHNYCKNLSTEYLEIHIGEVK